LGGLLSGNSIYGQGNRYDFIDTSSSVFQYQGSLTVNSLYQQWQNRFAQKFVILELGSDEIIKQQLINLPWLNQFQISPGIFFPSTFLGNNHPTVFPNSHTGKWVYGTTAENFPVVKPGLCGYAAKTDDAENASVTIEIPEILRKSTNKIRIYCERNETAFDIQVTTSSGQKKLIPIYQNKTDLLSPFVEFSFPLGQDWIKIHWVKTQGKQKSFTLHGISLEHSDFAVWHAIGIRGISLQRLQSIDGHYFQLQKLNPNLIVFDALQQDIFRNKSGNEILQYLRGYQQSIKRYLPKTSFILCVPQEINRNQNPISAGVEFTNLIRKELYNNNLVDWIVWDWHRTAGGLNSSYYWIDSGLLKSNSYQLTENGLKVKSYCLTSATQILLTKIPPKSRILPAIDSSKQLKKPIKDTQISKPIYKETWTYHIVKYGETAYRISAKYSISPNDLKQWNNLRGYYIYPGQKLKVGKVTEVIQPILPVNNLKTIDSSDNNKVQNIEKSTDLISPNVNNNTNKSVVVNPVFPKENSGTTLSSGVESPNSTNNPKINTTSTSSPASSSPKYHKVQPSETLYSISQKYGVSIDQIKRLNRLPNNNIAVGRLLRIW
jgi:LysM repeat protein